MKWSCRFWRPPNDYLMSERQGEASWVQLAQLQNPKKRGKTMRFMVLIKANKDSEAGLMPSEQLLTEMGKFNEELVKAGVMLAGEGLQPSSKGARVRFSGSKRTVIDGPFAETKELIAGFWIWQCKSKEEAIEWLKRCPNPHNEEADVEIRQIFEAEDFGAEFTPELRAQEERIRAQTEQLAKGNKRENQSLIKSIGGDAMKVEAYLFFDGRCEEAVEFYKKALDAEVTMLMRFKDSPEPQQPGMVPPGSENKIMHVSFRIVDSTVMASDGRCTGQTNFQGFSLSLTVANDTEAERKFAALAEGGQVQMPLTKTFWSPRFGMVADRFGVGWMISVAS